MRKKLPLISGILNVLEKLKGNTGIIENTSVATHTIAAGKYVIWKNDLYKASSAISIGDTLSLSNLTAISDGIANELNSNIVPSTGTSIEVKTVFGTNTLNGNVLSAVIPLPHANEKTITIGAVSEWGGSNYQGTAVAKNILGFSVQSSESSLAGKVATIIFSYQ